MKFQDTKAIRISKFLNSDGWCTGFLARRGFAFRRKTSQSQRLPDELSTKIVKFFTFVRSYFLLLEFLQGAQLHFLSLKYLRCVIFPQIQLIIGALCYTMFFQSPEIIILVHTHWRKFRTCAAQRCLRFCHKTFGFYCLEHIKSLSPWTA